MKNTKSSIPNSFGAATRVGSQSSTERRKILLFLKWEDAHFCFRNPFSFSLAAQLQHSFHTYAYIDDSLELLSRTHFPLSFSTPKYVVKCFLLQERAHSCWKKARLLLCHPCHVRGHRHGFSRLRRAVCFAPRGSELPQICNICGYRSVYDFSPTLNSTLLVRVLEMGKEKG